MGINTNWLLISYTKVAVINFQVSFSFGTVLGLGVKFLYCYIGYILVFLYCYFYFLLFIIIIYFYCYFQVSFSFGTVLGLGVKFLYCSLDTRGAHV